MEERKFKLRHFRKFQIHRHNFSKPYRVGGRVLDGVLNIRCHEIIPISRVSAASSAGRSRKRGATTSGDGRTEAGSPQAVATWSFVDPPALPTFALQKSAATWV